MKTRLFIVLLALVLLGGTAFAATAAAAEVPKYGGRITMLGHASAAAPDSPDLADGMYTHLYWLAAIQETPVVGDFEKFGPRGTNQYAFQSRGYIPAPYIRGNLVEKWEVTTEKITWHVRKGIMWAGRNVFKDRELTADDIRADLQYFYDSPASSRWKPFIKRIYTTDRYTVVMDYSQFSPFVMYFVGTEDRALISPPETKGSKKYEDQVGTGPFMFNEYAPGSYMSYTKNPNYWKTTTIGGKVYKLPFVDELRCMFIADASTALAAVRTGKIDFWQTAPANEIKSLKETSPDLKTIAWTAGGVVDCFKTTEPPFDNLAVRRAMFVATDFKALQATQNLPVEMPIHWYPYYIYDTTLYVPLEKLPANSQLLFKNDPALAKKMLADAGYPNGFKTEVTVPIGAEPIHEALKAQWAKVGVDLTIKAVDSTAHTAAIRGRTYTGLAYAGYDVVSAWNTVIDYGMKGKLNNYADWSDPKYEELANKVATVTSETERLALMKQALTMLFEGSSVLPLSMSLSGIFYWPWMKNYYGELTITDGAAEPLMAYVWIDEALKKKLGY